MGDGLGGWGGGVRASTPHSDFGRYVIVGVPEALHTGCFIQTDVSYKSSETILIWARRLPLWDLSWRHVMTHVNSKTKARLGWGGGRWFKGFTFLWLWRGGQVRIFLKNYEMDEADGCV